MDEAVADDTFSEKGNPPEIKAPLEDKDSVMKNVVVTVVGAVRKKLKIVPVPTFKTGVPLPPVEYVGWAKSVENPFVAVPVAPNTETVHEISSLTRTTLDRPLL